jgi:hypothetical protein
MMITNRQALKMLIEQYNGSKGDVAEEIITTFASTLGKWADKAFTQRVRKARVGGVEKVDPGSLELPLERADRHLREDTAIQVHFTDPSKGHFAKQKAG